MKNVDPTRLRVAVMKITEDVFFLTDQIWSEKWNRYIHDTRRGKAARPVRRENVMGAIDMHHERATDSE